MSKLPAKVLVTVFAMILSAPLYAGVVWDNGSATTNTGGNCSDCGTSTWKVFDDFTFGADTTIGGISYDAAFSGQVTDFEVSVQFWTGINTGLLETQTFDLGSSPAVNLTANTPVAGSTNYTVDIDLTDLLLTAGTYYVSVQGSNGGQYMAFGPAYSGQGANAHQVRTSSGSVNPRGYDMPFRLMGTTSVPAPATMVIFGLALLGVARSRRNA